jgi:hypothetical protein
MAAGFAEAVTDLFTSTASMYFDGGIGVVVQISELMSNQVPKRRF